ncbi:MAG: hypothetical protein ACFFB5_19590 [Promethearchaeota archaeon]
MSCYDQCSFFPEEDNVAAETVKLFLFFCSDSTLIIETPIDAKSKDKTKNI